MTKPVSKIESDANRLPIRDKAKLVRRLIATLESEDEGDVEQLWLDECDKRLAAYRRGESSSQPGEEVFEAILNRG